MTDEVQIDLNKALKHFKREACC